ncbi:MAG: hypothetical protein CO141_03550 [Candidatus Moranbacteria bacterium CG_4_9_14_3_um_filter_42_9]|nr:MAG: hypothetical protein CO141_03550 [Candidatus Moranbacteria bacterium CG_4_9_14_3_um_filter_42_9]
MNFREQPKAPIKEIEVESDEEIQKRMRQEAEPIRKIELDQEMEAVTEQVRVENETIGEGVFSKLPENLKKYAKILILGGTLLSGLGTSNAEAGDKSFFQKMMKEVEFGVLQGVGGDFDREQQRKNAEMWQRQQLESQANQMALNNAWAREQRQEQMSDQRIEERARAIRDEGRRFAQAIAQKGADLDHEEKIHNRILDDIKKNY